MQSGKLCGRDARAPLCSNSLLFKNLKPEEFQSADFIGEERQQRKRRMFQLYIYESIDGKRKLK